jgi:hypothetical protein
MPSIVLTSNCPRRQAARLERDASVAPAARAAFGHENGMAVVALGRPEIVDMGNGIAFAVDIDPAPALFHPFEESLAPE